MNSGSWGLIGVAASAASAALAASVALAAGCFSFAPGDDYDDDFDPPPPARGFGGPMPANTASANTPCEQGCETSRASLVEDLTPRPGWSPALAGSSIAMVDAERTLLVADSEYGRVFVVVDLETGESREIDVGDRPEQIVVAGPNTAWVSVRGEGRVVRVDVATRQVVATVKTAPGPCGMALSDDGAWLYVTHPEARLVTGIEIATDQPAWTIETEGEPRGVSAEPGGGRLHIAQRKPAGTAIIELAASGRPSNWRAVDLARTSKLIIAAQGVPEPEHADAIVPDPRDDRVYVPHMICDVDAPTTGFGAGGYYGTVESPPARPALSVISTSLFRDKSGLSGSDLRAAQAIFDVINQPSGAAHSPSKSVLAVAMHATDNVALYNTGGSLWGDDLIAVLAVGAGPKGVAWGADGERLYVHLELEQKVAVLALDLAHSFSRKGYDT